MEVVIDPSKKLIEIQKEFQKRFPYLKIEFYNKTHGQGEASAKEDVINTENTIEMVQKTKKEGVFKIQGLMTVTSLESAFEENYGLSVQVFRKSGNIWLQTTTTDHWTLAEQNQKASEKHNIYHEDVVDSRDLHDLE